MYKTITLDSEKNLLLCSPSLVGNGELIEIYSPDNETPPQACGRIIRKISDDFFEVHQVYDGHGSLGIKYSLGEKAIVHVLFRNSKGIKKRNFPDESIIVNIDKNHGKGFKNLILKRKKKK